MESVHKNGWNPLCKYSGKKTGNQSGDTKTLSGSNLSEANPMQSMHGRLDALYLGCQWKASKLMKQGYWSL